MNNSAAFYTDWFIDLCNDVLTAAELTKYIVFL